MNNAFVFYAQISILSNGTSYPSISLAKRKYTRKPVPLLAARLLCYRDTLTHLIATLQEILNHFFLQLLIFFLLIAIVPRNCQTIRW